MEDIIDIIVTETTNLIEITSQPTDEIIDVNIIDNREDVVLNVTPTVVEININSLIGNFGVNWGDITGTLANQTDLQNVLNLKADLVGGKVPSSQLPSYVDDVIEVANFASLPTTGETGKIYITLDTNFMYRWSGSTYIEIKDSSAVWGAITGTLSNQTDLQNALNSKEPLITSGTTSQYYRGDKTFQTLNSTAVTEGTNLYYLDTRARAAISGGNGISYNSGTGVITNLITQYTDALARGAISLTTTGANGSATYNSTTGVLNVPTYTLAGLGGQPLAGNLTALAGLQFSNVGFIKMTGVGTLSLDTNTYALDSSVVKLTGNQSVAGIKTFTSGVSAELLWIKEGAGFANPSGYAQLATDITYFHFNNSNNTAFARFLYGSGQRIYTLPSSDGTLALTSNLSAYLTTSVAASTYQTILTNPVTGSGGITTNYIPKYSGVNALGSSSIFEGASGYVSIGNTNQIYNLDVSGTGRFTGALSGTSATFNGNVNLQGGATRNLNFYDSSNTNINAQIQYDQITSNTGQLFFGTNNGGTFATRLTIASTGAATFSSSVTATSLGINGGNTYSQLESNTGTFGSTVALFSLAVKDGTYNPRTTVSYRTQTGSAYAVIFDSSYSSGWAPTNYVFNSGLLGIGTSNFNSNSALTVEQDQLNIFTLRRGGGGSNTAAGRILFQAPNSSSSIQNIAIIEAGLENSSTNGYLAFYSNTTERMRITSGGVINIGTSSQATNKQIQFQLDNTTNYYGLLNNSSRKDYLNINGGDGASYTSGANITLIGSDRYGTNMGGQLVLSAGNSSGDTSFGHIELRTSGSERARITSGGNVLIGTTSDNGNKLRVSASSNWTTEIINNNASNQQLFMLFTYNSTGLGSIQGNGTIVSYYSTSDYRLKEDLKSINGLEIINKIKVYDYKWKDSQNRMDGVMAHELAEVLPYAVSGVKDGKDMQQVDYSKIVPVMVQAIKDLKAELDTLKNK